MARNKTNISFVVALIFLNLSFYLPAQQKYWVKLKDKTGTPHIISNPGTFLTQKAITRRAAYNIALDQTDLPVTPNYINQIENITNVNVLYASKWLNGVVVSIPNTATQTALATISALPFVINTDKVRRYHISIPPPVEHDPNTVKDQSQRGSSTTLSTFNYGGSFWQNEQLNLICLHEQGFRGQGMTIAVLDAGFQDVNTFSVFDSIRNSGRILGTRDFVSGASDAYFGSRHGTMVLSCIAGNKPGRILGSAPMAKFWLLRTEEGAAETISEEYNWIRGAEFADSVGADILTTSLGYTEFDDASQNHTYATLNGKTAPMSIAGTMAARKGLFVLTAAGNEGGGSWRYISVPGDADSVCTVGAIDSLANVVTFSSVGPTADGRIKPDLVARGHACWVSDGVYDGFPGNGTSFATPVLAGAVACYWQANKSLNNMQVFDILKKNATNACTPNNSMGWGLPKMCPIASLSKTLTGIALLNGQTDHSGIKVKLITDTINGFSDSTLTNANGAYSFVTSSTSAKLILTKESFRNVSFIKSPLNNLSKCNTVPTLTLVPLVTIVPAEIDFDFTAYSDPENAQMTVLLTKAGYDYISVEIYDLLGRLLYSYKPNKDETSIYVNASAYTDEIYLVKVKTSKGTKTKKILKQ